MKNINENKLLLPQMRGYFSFLTTTISGLLLGGSLASLSNIRQPKKAVDLINYNLFTWRMLSNKGLPVRQIEEIFELQDDDIISFSLTPNYLHGWYATFNKDRFYLALLSQIIRPACVFEIGTLRGWSALVFALNTQPECEVYTLDLPRGDACTLPMRVLDAKYVKQHNNVLENYAYNKLEQGRCKVRQVYGDSANFDFSAFENKVGIFFIDGAHSYEYVRSDSINALKCVQEGGVIVWHDYGRGSLNGVSKFLEELRKTGRDIVRLPGSSLAILRV